MNDHDITKLPKWAQHRINKLEADVESLERKITEVETRDTDVFIWQGMMEDDIPLPRGSRIVFRVDGGDRNNYFHASLIEDGSLEIYGGASFEISPSSSNVIRVKIRDRFST